MVDSSIAFQKSGRLLHELQSFSLPLPTFSDDAAEPERGSHASFITQMC
jgi:hypothetical protein